MVEGKLLSIGLIVILLSSCTTERVQITCGEQGQLEFRVWFGKIPQNDELSNGLKRYVEEHR